MRILRLIVVAIASAGFVGESRATILIFDQSRDASTSTIVEATSAGARVQQDYGDNVTGSPMNVLGGQFTYGNGGEGFTPNVVVGYFSESNVALWTTGYGDLGNVLFATVGAVVPSTLNVRLTADPGFEVQLYHFDLAGWPNADYTINGVSVSSDTTTLFSQSNVLVEGNPTGPQHTAFDFLTPLIAQELLISIDFSNLTNAIRDNIGIDNIRFGQIPPAAVPLPSAGLLLGSGLMILSAWFRRRRAGIDVSAPAYDRGLTQLDLKR